MKGLFGFGDDFACSEIVFRVQKYLAGTCFGSRYDLGTPTQGFATAAAKYVLCWAHAPADATDAALFRTTVDERFRTAAARNPLGL